MGGLRMRNAYSLVARNLRKRGKEMKDENDE
jgi:hypothetical protein